MEYNVEVDMSNAESYFFKLPRDLKVSGARGVVADEHSLFLTIFGETDSPDDLVYFKLGVCAPDDESSELKEMPESAIPLVTRYYGTDKIQGPRLIAYLDPSVRIEPWFNIPELVRIVS